MGFLGKFLLKKFFRHCRRPQGAAGRLMLRMMNGGHGPVCEWGLDQSPWEDGARVLDVGCGGGGNIARMFRRYPRCRVDGVDYSAASVEMARRKNAARLGENCEIREGDVMSLPYDAGTYDIAVAIETVYFWPSLVGGLRQVRRVLRSGGLAVVICEGCDPGKMEFWADLVGDMRVYTPDELAAAFAEAGFHRVETATNKGRFAGWVCVKGVA